ncbi:hypothetical protein F5878DRAFT_707108 [Lentinula raphanica]|uniref:Uncharacterized protein n=1 Tax=Lentinula raphanica TaxID=153919 RepID=A0AA38PHE4_9AGAR|nr:hypothetical protein F5878DRAFT_707108 [Lentinula raphanica]
MCNGSVISLERNRECLERTESGRMDGMKRGLTKKLKEIFGVEGGHHGATQHIPPYIPLGVKRTSSSDLLPLHSLHQTSFFVDEFSMQMYARLDSSLVRSEETDHSKNRWRRSAKAAICVFGNGRPPSSSTNYATEPMSQRSPHDLRRRPELRDEFHTPAQPFMCSLWTTSPGRARKERCIDHLANNGGLGGASTLNIRSSNSFHVPFIPSRSQSTSRLPASTLFLPFYLHYVPASSPSSAHLKYNTQLQNTLLRHLTRYMPLTLCTPNLPTRLTQFQQDPSIPLLGRLLRVSPPDLILYLLMPNGHGQSWSKREFRQLSILTNVLRLILRTRTEVKGEQDE